VILQIAGGLNLDQTPAPIAPTMQNVHFHEHVLVLKHRLEKGWHGFVTHYLASRANRLTQTALADLHSTRKKLSGKHADIVSLLDDCFCRSIRLSGKFWLVNLEVKAREALHARDKLGFG
jgi:hypothetical protein